MTQRKARIIVSLTIALLPLLWFYPALTGKLALVHSDGWVQHIGMRYLIGSSVAQGMLPLWNPYVLGGMPLMATVYPGAFYPLNWLFAFLPTARAMNLVVILTYHIAMVGMYRYARAIGCNRVGAVLSSIAFTFGGFMVMSMGITAKIAATSWLPWILLALEKVYQRAVGKWTTLGATFIALQFLAGFPQMTFYSVLVGGAYFIFSVLFRSQRQPRWRVITATVTMAVSGALLAMIQLLPLRELQQQGDRTAISYDNFASHNFPLRQMPALLFPYFFGGASLPPYRVPYWGEWGIYVTASYAGMIALTLALTTVIGFRRLNRLVWFWAGIAIAGVLLAGGDSLPLGINHLLYQIPVYNLFRNSARHLMEFNLATAVLAGMGLTYLSSVQKILVWRALRRSLTLLTGLIIATIILYLYLADRLSSGIPLPPGAASLSNPELLIPLLFFLLSSAALLAYARWQHNIAAIILLVLVLCDLAAYGMCLNWRTLYFDINEAMSDPQAVRFIKSRETDLQSFRILTVAPNPYDAFYVWLNYPNVSLIRGLQSVNVSDELRLKRPAEVMGNMAADGVITDASALAATHQGFNLYNVRYLLFERPGATDNPADSVMHDGVRFNQRRLEINLEPGGHLSLGPAGTATELAIISSLSRAELLGDNMPVARIRLHTVAEQIIERDILAGRDTAEWAYERGDVSKIIRHRRAQVVENHAVDDPAGQFAGHRYLAHISFPRADIQRIEIISLTTNAVISLSQASLFDAQTGASRPVDAGRDLPSDRWRKLAAFGVVEVYENLQALPRAWFVSRSMRMPESDILRAIKAGRLPDGSPFDPARVALLETETTAGLPVLSQDHTAQVTIQRYEPQRIELATRNSADGFLVLSENYYAGWIARIDGTETPVYRTDYSLRGIVVPAGNHQIEFLYRPQSLRQGFLAALTGLLLLPGFAAMSRQYFSAPVDSVASLPSPP